MRRLAQLYERDVVRTKLAEKSITLADPVGKEQRIQRAALVKKSAMGTLACSTSWADAQNKVKAVIASLPQRAGSEPP
eukprot:7289887-Alexandrium_andersonii.AAC.1